MTEASNITKIHITAISMNCNKKRKTAGNFIFCFDGDLPEKYKRGKKVSQVCQYNIDNLKLINEFESITEAIKKTNIKGISNCCSGKSKSAGGFIWKYKKDGHPKEKYKKKTTGKKVFQFKLNGELINEFNSISEAEKILNIQGISNVCNKRTNTAGGYIWSYENMINIENHKNKSFKKVALLDSSKNRIKIFKSVNDAAKSINLSGQQIIACCKGYANSAGGKLWEYV